MARLAVVRGVLEANTALADFAAEYNAKFAVVPESPDTAFAPLDNRGRRNAACSQNGMRHRCEAGIENNP
jgi:hypothetical protein